MRRLCGGSLLRHGQIFMSVLNSNVHVLHRYIG
eukprot:COSAG02_NODE_39468_length_416_cov_317.776025_1_plen_32_part_10